MIVSMCGFGYVIRKKYIGVEIICREVIGRVKKLKNDKPGSINVISSEMISDGSEIVTEWK